MRFLVLSMLPLCVLSACAPAAETAPPPAAPAPVAAEPVVAPPPAPPPPPPSAEELKKAEDAKKLAAEFDALENAHKAELARLTPEVRAAAKALDRVYPSARAALNAALPSAHRDPKSAQRDTQRHPVATLEFLGLRPNLKVLEIGPGEGWYTELLAPALAQKGKLFVTSGDPNAPKDQRPTLYAQRTKLFLERLPEVYGKVQTVLVDSKQPKLAFDSELDLVLLFRGAHGMFNNQALGTWLAEVHRSLKPNGVLGIEQQRAAPGAKVEEVSKKGYLPEAWLKEQVEAAGFKLVAKSEINANPKDTKDYPEGVWSLPPTLREGDKDRAKYVAIGEADRMTLKFVKVTPPKPKAEAAPKAASPAAPPAAPAAPKAASPAAPPAAPAAPKAASPAAPAPTPAPVPKP